MGIVQMPDGTALPENIANEILYGGKSYPGLGSYGLQGDKSANRRASVGTGSQPSGNLMLPPPAPKEMDGAASPPKRKRTDDEDEEEGRGRQREPRAGSHKRIMSSAEQVISELKALRMEMEEGSAWYRAQSERLQSEMSRGSTPWDESI